MTVLPGAFLKHELALFTGHIFPKEGAKATIFGRGLIQIHHSCAALNYRLLLVKGTFLKWLYSF